MLCSVRMRAAQGGSHETGGRHISGAERLVSRERADTIIREMLQRAYTHTRGKADFVNITVEEVDDKTVLRVPQLPVRTITAIDVATGRAAALRLLEQAGVAERAAKTGMSALMALPDSMRGAMLVSAVDGSRIDRNGERGIRVSRMDAADEAGLSAVLAEQGLTNIHVREAVVLASKVLSAPGIVAELCWSDDPEYTVGYVATRQEYVRIPRLKPFGSPVGGRVFFVEPGIDMQGTAEYLEQQPVLVAARGREGQP